MDNRYGYTDNKKAKGARKPEGKFMAFLKKLGVTNPLLQVALPAGLALVVATVASCAIFGGGSGSSHGIKEEISVTYDTPLTVELFLEEGTDASKCEFVSDVSVIDMSQIASYKLTLANDGNKVTSVLNVIDDVPPVADPVPQKVYSLELPDPNDCITNLYDKSEVTVTYAEGTDLSAGGNMIVNVIITDAYDNRTVVEVPFEVTSDVTPPVILGTRDLEFMAGVVPDYAEGVTVTDDMDPNPQLIIDDTEVDPYTVGQYPLTYMASDAGGNEAMITVTVTVIENDGSVPTTAPRGNGGNGGSSRGGRSNNGKYSKCTPSDAYAKARKIYNSICNSSMSDVKRGLKIFYWVNHNISFSFRGVDHTSWAAAACQAFGNRRSSCYGQWAACKALCDVAGIPNRKVWRSNAAKVHVWCLCYLNGGWYHCDATQWPGMGHYFAYMMTDAEIRKAPGNHRFITSGLPARATKSVQKYINIYSCSVSDQLKIKATPTPLPTTVAPPTPTAKPTASPTSAAPTEESKPTASPTESPATAKPTTKPSDPTEAPATAKPTSKPTEKPTDKPAEPTDNPDNTDPQGED